MEKLELTVCYCIGANVQSIADGGTTATKTN